MKNMTLVLSLSFIPFFAFAVNRTVGASGADYLTDGSNDEVEILTMQQRQPLSRI